MGSFPIGYPKFAALADVVIAPVWSTEEQGSIPWGGTNQYHCRIMEYTPVYETGNGGSIPSSGASYGIDDSFESLPV